MKSASILFCLVLAMSVGVQESRALTLSEAVNNAVTTHPKVGEAAAERRATKYELLQSKGRMLPEVELEADVRWQKTDSNVSLGTAGNNVWLDGNSVSVSAKQILFDGWERHYGVYKNAARLDSASLRLLERGEATALDAVEAFINVRRYTTALGFARQNVSRHNRILDLVQTQFDGGKVPASDVNQIRSRVSAAEAVVAIMKKQLGEAKASFRATVGLEPHSLQPVAYPTPMPASKTDAITIATAESPAIRAALANADAADHARDQRIGSYLPEVSAEGMVRNSHSINGNPGFDDEYVGKVVLRWNVFDGMIRHNRHRELSERANLAKLQTESQRRAVTRSTDVAWTALTTGRERETALTAQVAASEKVVEAFLEEYELTRRTLFEVLDAESLLFNARIQLVGAKSLRLFAAYQLVAVMGRLIESLGLAAPQETVADAQERELYFVNPFDVFLDPLHLE